jgi:hypothetical protein
LATKRPLQQWHKLVLEGSHHFKSEDVQHKLFFCTRDALNSSLQGEFEGEFHTWKWGLNFLRWAAGLTTDVCENASAHGDDRSPLKSAKPS